MGLTYPVLAGAGLYPIAVGPMLSFNDDNTDATPATELVGAPGVGKAIYLKSVTYSSRTTDVAVTLQDEDDTVLFGPIKLQSDGSGLFTKNWEHPLKLTDNKALEVLATEGVDFTIYGEYFIGQAPII